METNGLHRAHPLKPDSNGVGAETVRSRRREGNHDTIYGAGAPDVSKERLRHEWCVRQPRGKNIRFAVPYFARCIPPWIPNALANSSDGRGFLIFPVRMSSVVTLVE